jgi:hypothetical protein
MKKAMSVMASMAILLLGISCATAQPDLVKTVADGCKVELEKYCADVTQGDGKVLACLYAHGEKFSPKCEYALYDAAVQLERAVAALSYLVNECDDDMEKYCSAIEPGEGRVLDCLNKQGKNVSERCRTAIKDMGLK